MLISWLKKRAVTIAAVGGSLLLFAVWLIPGDVAGTQNRAEREFPELSAETAVDASTFAAVDSALRDRLGVQVSAVALAAWVGTTVGISPNSTTFLGKDGEPFFSADFIFPCRGTDARMAMLESALVEDAAAIEAGGGYVIYTVAPNKSSVRDEQLGAARDSLLRCSDKVRNDISGWQADGEIPLITLWDELRTLDQTRQGKDDGAYYFGDSHWNAQGAAVWVKALLSRLVKDGVAPASVLDSLSTYREEAGEVVIPDLFRNIGVDESVERVELVYERPGVTTTTGTIENSSGTQLTHATSVSTDAALIPGKTLVLGDSFLRTHSITQLKPFFSDVTFGSLAEYADAAEYDTVIVERVQRNAAEPGWPDFSAAG